MTATWRGLLAIALLTGLYLIPVTLISCGLFFIWFFQIDEGISAFWVFTAVLQGFWFWWLLFAVFTAAGVTGTPPYASAAISREQAPELWDQVTALAREVGTRPPKELRLSAVANAGVVEETRLAGLIPVTRRMYLGIPLLVTLPPEQLAAVMGHELGHYARGHTRVGPVCYRARAAADQLLDRLNLATAWGKAPLRAKLNKWIILRYSEIYNRLSSPVTQDQEFQADAKAAQIMGPLQMAAALCGVHAVLVAWDSFITGARDEDREWAPDPFDEFWERWQYHHVRAEAAEMAARAVHDPFGTHPPLHERLAKLLGDQAGTMATDWINAPAAPPAATAPDVPLAATERTRLFHDEVRTRRERAARRERAPAVPARPSRLAVLRTLPLLLEKHPAAAAMAAIIVLTVAGFGGFEGHEHARPPAPAFAVSASPMLPDTQEPSSQPAPAASTPAPQPSDIPGIPSFIIPALANYLTVVQPGDTLSSIASCWHTTVADIQRLNHLGKSTLIRSGELLWIPSTGPSGQPLTPPTGNC
ncbi:MAG TPA: M48 family metalloprotease [Streptosporangiaceae bacterium]|nr:M48 family metalloprotease [Streptosporangiaceae bacterium]